MYLQVVMGALLAGSALAAVRLDIKCSDHGAFACHSSDPGAFTRCLEGQLFEFYCPDGLHFNTKTQTCDWPESADCGGGGGSKVQKIAESAAGDSGSSGSSGSSGHGATPRPWWRPKNVDPASWERTDNLFELPFDKSGSEGAGGSEGASGSAGSSGSSGSEGTAHTEAPSAPVDHGHGEESHQPAPAQPQEPVHNPISASADNRPDHGSVHKPSGECGSHNCKLPDCYCPGSSIPHGLSPSSTPQMVMLTFDDEVSAAYYGYFQRLFRPGRYNPNGCPVRGCLYVSGSGTDYDLVYPLYAMGVEVASHTLSHRFPHTWWSSASYREYYDEILGMRNALSEKAGIPYEAVKGFRVPFLQLGGDNMYKTLYDGKFTYDTSMFTGAVWEGGEPVWPFTLDFVPSQYYCQHGPCPQDQYPGLWEIPVQRWYGVDGHSCAMPDGCTSTGDAEEALEFFRSNFLRYYNSNRAPLGIFVHARWFHTEHHIDALDRFIDELLQMDDVYIVTPSQVIEWMKNPTPVHSVGGFGPWSCEGAVDRRKK